MSDKIYIFDTTLRDGEQSPGATMNTSEKIRLAKQLERLGVDVIEAGFPIASSGDFQAVEKIALNARGVQVSGLARANPKDIETAWEAIKKGEAPRIHTFIATSPIHMEQKLRMPPEKVLEAAREAVKLAKKFTSNVQFSAEDAGRSDIDFLCRVTEEVIRVGATTVNIPDTVGYTLPHEFGERIKYLMENVPNIHQAVISVHCHNDLGLAVANSLAAVRNGARQVECTINGIGERAGNASLEEVVMAVRTRADILNCHTDINTREIFASSRLVTHITGIIVQPNKAVVGANAFAHEAGIHQDGVLKDKRTYEIMTPESIGATVIPLVLGKHSGSHAFKIRLEELGYHLEQGDIDRVFSKFKELTDKKKEIFDDDLHALVAEEVFRSGEKYRLEFLTVLSGCGLIPTATVALEIDGEMKQLAGFGSGPVDAVFNTIAKLTNTGAKLLRFAVNAITGGTDAQGEVTVRIEEDGMIVIGQGSDPDIISASAKAYINALNRLDYIKNNPRIKA